MSTLETPCVRAARREDVPRIWELVLELAVYERLEAIGQWLTAPLGQALELQRPLPNGTLQIVARGEKKDG